MHLRTAELPGKRYVRNPRRVANSPARPQRAGGQVPRAQSSKKGTDAAAAACMVLPPARRVGDAQQLMPEHPGPAPPRRDPRLAWPPPPSPGRCCGGRPWRCRFRLGAASVLHCAPRALPLAGGASECCIGRLAVANWFLAPPTSFRGKGSGRRRARQGAQRLVHSPPARGQGRAHESRLGNVVLSPRPARLHDRADYRDLVTTRCSTA